ncbi:MAG: hypothetical protein OMM_00006 [Candidatus Magnetoglobus multicellularis str. Araruama]|uniref:Uncharacterized protein n=1 Tax=Candidatus Magnetoglobus multicellularis str. Araruama TaxID=890399 RepID=A0A1V1PID6_9BACT|nr:MAG: hypothetical protein OMM_00006 [Candidatus Magnetoglobus multicellularis str. Araruama]
MYDFGTHPLGISQTTKEFYLCARDIEESSEDSTSEITIIDKKEENQKQLKPKAIHRWNVPDSRSRVNMNQWRKKNRIAIHIDPPYITGDNANAFKLQHNQCHENVLFPGSKCQFDITFQPKGEGKQKANIIIPYSKKGIKEYLTVFVTGSAERKTRQSKVVSIFFQEVKTSAHCQ